MTTSDSIQLDDLRSIHIVGAGGAGMSALAKLLSQLGHQVTGSDLKPGRALDALGDLGITTWVGHRPDQIAGVDLVVASSAVPDGDPEVRLVGFGLDDAHSVANSLQWGPDGWLYGVHGSTVNANVRGIKFQQGIWRYHPASDRPLSRSPPDPC